MDLAIGRISKIAQDHSGAQPNMSAVAERAVSRFRRFLADCFPTELELARHREAQGQDDLCLACGADGMQLNARGLCSECAP